MSAKKKTASGVSIQSFFQPTKPAKKQEVQSINLVDDEDDEEVVAVKKSNENTAPVKNPFFMSKTEKSVLAAQERETRIQEEIARNRIATNKLLIAKESNEHNTSNTPHAFFQARFTNLKPREEKNIQELDCMDDESATVAFPEQQCVGFNRAVAELEEHVKSINNTYEIIRRKMHTSLPSDLDQTLIGSFLQHVSASCNWGQLGIGNSFTSTMGRNNVGLPWFGPANSHPMAHSTLNLRAAWAMWASSTKPTQGETCLALPSSSSLDASHGRNSLEKWLKQWADKRSVESKPNLSENVASHSSRRSKVGTNESNCNSKGKGVVRGKRRRRGDSSDDDSIQDSSEDEWSVEADSSGEECESNRRRSVKSTTGDRVRGDEGEEEMLENVMVIEGPSGCGKSSAVRECATLLGFKVIEVNAGEPRSGAAVKKTIFETAQLNSANTSRKNLILFDEVDIVFEEEGDTQLYSAIQQIAHISKCPILLTTERPLPFFKALHAKHVTFSRPSSSITECAQAVYSLAQSAEVTSLSPQHTNKFNVLCDISAGDARAALASMQCFSSHLDNRIASTPLVVDLTETKAPAENLSAISPHTFHSFLGDRLGLDFAIFDSLYDGVSPFTQSSDIKSECVLVAPIVAEVSPRSGLCSGGFTVSICGGNFLQSSSAEDGTRALADVQVRLGSISCPCVVKSDSLIIAYIPPIHAAGVHVVVVEVRAKVLNKALKVSTVRASSEVGGIGGSWIQLYQRYTPPLLLRTQSSASALSYSARASTTANSANSDQESDEQNRAGTDSDDISVTGEDVACRTEQCSPPDRKRNSKTLSDVPTSTETNKSVMGDCEGSAPSKRRKRVIRDESDEDDDDKNEGEVNLNSTPHSKHMAASAQSNTCVNYKCVVEEIGQVLKNVCMDALKAMLDCSYSDPFLQPISDDIAEGYSSVVLKPMDLETIHSSIEEGLYEASVSVSPDGGVCDPVAVCFFDIAAMITDVRLVWSNCILYNGASSPYVRSAYILHTLFEDTMRTRLIQFSTNNPFLCAHTYSKEIIEISISGVPEATISIPVCTCFESCTKLTRTLSDARIHALISEAQRSSGIETLFLTEEQALSPEIIPVNELLDQLSDCNQNRNHLLDKRLGTTCGLEYECDLESGCILILEKILDEMGRSHGSDGSQICNLSDYEALCDADVLNTSAWKLSSGSMCDIDEDPIAVDYSCFATQIVKLSPPSYAQNYLSAVRLSQCASVLTSAIKRSCLQNNSELSQSSSTFLSSRTRRWMYSERVCKLANYYCPTYNTKMINANGRIGNEQIYSACRIPLGYSIDIVPVISKMCNVEHISDIEYAQRHREGESGKEVIEVAQRSTRRTSRNNPAQRELFRYMRVALNCCNVDFLSIVANNFVDVSQVHSL